MFSTARTQFARHCSCIARTAATATAARSIPPRTFSSTPYARADDLPWFVDPASAPADPSPSSSASSTTLATAPVPTAPPPHLAPALFPLHAHLSVSPFFDRDALTYIHAREADPMASWCDWVVLCTLREGRERGLRGAVEGVRTYLAANPVEVLDSPSEDESSSSSLAPPFSPPATHPAIHGLPPTTASKHARSRAHKGGPAPTRQDQASGWALLDAGTLVVHVMTRDARRTYGDEIERVWAGVAHEEGVVPTRDRIAAAERDRELQDNLREVRAELEAEEEEEEKRRRNGDGV
ncbi:hypothetical protein JCM11491_003713 [Sporobolomyces phaffii]